MPTARQKLVKKLDTEFSLYIRERDGHCVTCGSAERLTNGHLFSRVAHSTRWSELNCHCQCWGCNYRHEFDPYPFLNWFENKFGKEALDELHREFVTPRKYKDHDLQELFEQVKSKRTK